MSSKIHVEAESTEAPPSLVLEGTDTTSNNGLGTNAAEPNTFNTDTNPLSPLANKHKKKKKLMKNALPTPGAEDMPRDFLSPASNKGNANNLSPAPSYVRNDLSAGAQYTMSGPPMEDTPNGDTPNNVKPRTLLQTHVGQPSASYTDLRKSAIGQLPRGIAVAPPKPKRAATLPASLFADQGLPADKALQLDAGIDPTLPNSDKKAIIQYRGAVRRMSMVQPKAELEAEVAAMVKYFEDRTREPKFLILPESAYMGRWDMITLLALMFTAFVTPYEVALLNTEALYADVNTWDVLFTVNRLIDFIFLKDMGMQVSKINRQERVETAF